MTAYKYISQTSIKNSALICTDNEKFIRSLTRQVGGTGPHCSPKEPKHCNLSSIQDHRLPSAGPELTLPLRATHKAIRINVSAFGSVLGYINHCDNGPFKVQKDNQNAIETAAWLEKTKGTAVTLLRSRNWAQNWSQPLADGQRTRPGILLHLYKHGCPQQEHKISMSDWAMPQTWKSI